MRSLLRLDRPRQVLLVVDQGMGGFVEADLRAVLNALLDQERGKLLGEHLRMAGNVVDEFLRIERDELAAQDREGVDQLDRHLPHASIERGIEPGRSGTDDREVNDPRVVYR